MKTHDYLKITQTMLVWLICTFGLFAQTGTLKGKVIDKTTKDPIPFASIVVEKGGKQLMGTAADFNGEYTIKPIPPGTYDVRATNVGYNTVLNTNIVISSDKYTFQDFYLEPSTTTLSTVQIVCYSVPLIDMDRTNGSVLKNKKSKNVNITPVNNPVNNSANNKVFTASKKVKKPLPLIMECENDDVGINYPDIFFNMTDKLNSFNTIYSDSNILTESYEKITENEFENVTESPLSTFSIDVDDASYSNTRRFIVQGIKPPSDAVRTEELINYFDYDYPSPVGDEAFAIYSEVSQCPWNSKNKLVRIGIQGKQIDTAHLPKSNLVFLLDVSGSMMDEYKLPLVKKSMTMLVDHMREDDKIAIVIFSTTTSVYLKSTFCKMKQVILASIDQLKADGSTSGAEGIKLAYTVAKENFITNGNNRVIIATDGDFNVGPSSDAEIEKLITEKRKEGIFLSILGFGMGNYQDAKLEKMADNGNGNYAYIDNLNQANKVLVKEMGATLFTIAKDVKIQVEFNPAYVKKYRLIGYEDRLLENKDFNDDTKDAGELGAGSSVTAVYEISTFEQIPANNEMMKVKIRYKSPKEFQSKFAIDIIDNECIDLANTSENFKFTAAVIEFSMLLRDSKFKGNASYKEVIKLANEGKGTDAEGYRAEFIKMAEIAAALK